MGPPGFDLDPDHSGPPASSDDPIPLVEGELSGAVIVPTADIGNADHPTLRGARDAVRRECDHVFVCVSLEERSGLVEHVECPVIDISASGLRVQYDKRIDIGIAGHVAYRRVDQQPVRVACTVKRCERVADGLYELGLRFKRRLDRLEQRPMKSRPGREFALGVRTRRLRVPPTAVSPNIETV